MKVSVNVVLEIVTLRDQKKKKLKARQQNRILVPFRGSFQNLQQVFNKYKFTTSNMGVPPQNNSRTVSLQ